MQFLRCTTLQQAAIGTHTHTRTTTIRHSRTISSLHWVGVSLSACRLTEWLASFRLAETSFEKEVSATGLLPAATAAAAAGGAADGAAAGPSAAAAAASSTPPPG